MIWTDVFKNQTWQVEAKMIAILPLNCNKCECKTFYHLLLNENALPVSFIIIVFELKKTYIKYHADCSFFLYNSKCSWVNFHSNIVFKVHLLCL